MSDAGSGAARPQVEPANLGADVDSAWGQKKLEARKMPHAQSAVPSVQCALCWALLFNREHETISVIIAICTLIPTNYNFTFKAQNL